MGKKSTTVYGGIGFWAALFLVLLVLKLTKVITWSWWWVASPLFAPYLIFAVIFTGVVIYKVWQDRKQRRRNL